METVYEPLSDAKLKELAQRIEDWKNQYEDAGGVRLIEVPGDEGDDFSGIFRIPTREDLERSSRKDMTEMQSNVQLCMLTVLYPEPTVFQAVLQRSWGLSVPLAKKLLELSRVTREARAKKL